MKNTIVLCMLLICIFFSFIACIHLESSTYKQENVFLVNIGGDCFTMNMSLSFVMWSSRTCGDAGQAIPVYNRDLLAVTFKDRDDIPLFIQYDKKYGNTLVFHYESENNPGFLYSMNDSVIQVNLIDDPVVWQWLEDASRNDLAGIRTLLFAEDIDPSRFTLLEKIAKVNNHPGIYLKNAGTLKNILTLFQPDWIYIENWNLDDEHEDVLDEVYPLLEKQKNLKTVYFQSNSGNPDHEYAFLSSIPGLKSVMLSSAVINQAPAKSLPDNVHHLEELLIAGIDGEEVSDISIIKELANLKRIRFIGSAITGNIEDLYSLPGITTLSFTGSNVRHFPDVKEWPGIKWFSFPANTDQAYFTAFCEKNPGIEYLEIPGCENIDDLSPLMYVNNLKGLILMDMEIDDYSPLYKLKNLAFLILPASLFKENGDNEIEELKNELPDTEIVCGEPFCLGSGWIVLFPLSILACFVFIVCLKKYRIWAEQRPRRSEAGKPKLCAGLFKLR